MLKDKLFEQNSSVAVNYMCQRSKKRLPNKTCNFTMNGSIYALIQRSVLLGWLINVSLCSILKRPLDRICKYFKNLLLPVSVLSSAVGWNWHVLNSTLWNYKIILLQWLPVRIKLEIRVEYFPPKRTAAFSSFTPASAIPVTPFPQEEKCYYV